MNSLDLSKINTPAALDALKAKRAVLAAIVDGKVYSKVGDGIKDAERRLAEHDALIAEAETRCKVREAVERVRILRDSLQLVRKVDGTAAMSLKSADDSFGREIRAVTDINGLHDALLRAVKKYTDILDVARRGAGLAERDKLDADMRKAVAESSPALRRNMTMSEAALIMKRVCGADAVSKRQLERWILHAGKAAKVNLPVSESDLSSLAAWESWCKAFLDRVTARKIGSEYLRTRGGK